MINKVQVNLSNITSPSIQKLTHYAHTSNLRIFQNPTWNDKIKITLPRLSFFETEMLSNKYEYH